MQSVQDLGTQMSTELAYFNQSVNHSNF